MTMKDSPHTIDDTTSLLDSLITSLVCEAESIEDGGGDVPYRPRRELNRRYTQQGPSSAPWGETRDFNQSRRIISNGAVTKRSLSADTRPSNDDDNPDAWLALQMEKLREKKQSTTKISNDWLLELKRALPRKSPEQDEGYYQTQSINKKPEAVFTRPIPITRSQTSSVLSDRRTQQSPSGNISYEQRWIPSQIERGSIVNNARREQMMTSSSSVVVSPPPQQIQQQRTGSSLDSSYYDTDDDDDVDLGRYYHYHKQRNPNRMEESFRRRGYPQTGSTPIIIDPQPHPQPPPTPYFNSRRREDNIYSDNNSRLSRATTPTSVSNKATPLTVDTSGFWYKPHATRDQTIQALVPLPIGSFLIRNSNSFPGAFGLAVKSDSTPSEKSIRHFLIEPTRLGVRLRGMNGEGIFGSLSALVYAHSVDKLSLPVTLTLPEGEILQDDIAGVGSSTEQLLQQGAACGLLFVGVVGVERLSGEDGVRRGVERVGRDQPVPISLRLSRGGLTLTDVGRRRFFRLHFPLSSLLHASIVPGHTLPYENEEKQVFGIVVRGRSNNNEVIVLGELEKGQPAAAIVSFINRVVTW